MQPTVPVSQLDYSSTDKSSWRSAQGQLAPKAPCRSHAPRAILSMPYRCNACISLRQSAAGKRTLMPCRSQDSASRTAGEGKASSPIQPAEAPSCGNSGKCQASRAAALEVFALISVSGTERRQPGTGSSCLQMRRWPPSRSHSAPMDCSSSMMSSKAARPIRYDTYNALKCCPMPGTVPMQEPSLTAVPAPSAADQEGQRAQQGQRPCCAWQSLAAGAKVKLAPHPGSGIISL